MEGKKGSKFNYDEYAIKNDQSKLFIETINQRTCMRKCICGNYNESKCFQCFKCKQKIHYCVKVQINRPQIHSFECPSCLAKCMDLIYQPNSILLETFYRFQNIFQRPNTINFQFNLKFQQTKYPIDVRCFKGNKIELSWPMQGQFYLNGSKTAAFVLRPLKSNSNRKNRKEDNFLIKPQLLRQGKNILTFKLPRLQKVRFIDLFQYQQTGIFYLAIYSVKELTIQQVLNITQKERRHQKDKTLALFNQGDDEVPTQKQKVRLIDPYTCERIKFPVRGRYCTHLSTVCLLTYISFQKKSRTWKCPICSVEANSFLNEPYLDIWMYEMLKQPTKSQSVIIYPNGIYEWEQVKNIEMNLDSDDESIVRKSDNNIIQEEPIIVALQNFDLQSHPNHTNQLQQIDLIDYQENKAQQFPQLTDINQFINPHINFQKKPLERYQNYEINHQPSSIELQDNASHQPIITETLNKDQLAYEQIVFEDSNSQYEFPFNNQFVTSSKLQNIKITTNSTQLQNKDSIKTPQIYTKPLEKLPKPAENKPQSNVNKKFSLQVLDSMKKSLLEKLKKKQNASKISNPKKDTQENQLQSQKDHLVKIQREKVDQNKRLLHRPTFIQQMQLIKLVKYSTSNVQKSQSLSFGKVKRKNIELSQGKVQKIEAKMESVSKKLSTVFPAPKLLKKEQHVEKVKSTKIKSIKCDIISHNKFVKNYCNIPIPSLFRKMNEDLKRVFKNILETK